MLSLRLELPSEARKDSYLSLLAEFKERDEILIPFPLGFDTQDFDAFLKEMENGRKGLGLAEGFVANTTYWLVADNKKVVAVSNLRHELTDALRKEGGHIGYGVRPSARRLGYATCALKETLNEAKLLGIEKCMITCNKENTGSAKTILNNGGILESEAQLKDKNYTSQRYWINLS